MERIDPYAEQEFTEMVLASGKYVYKNRFDQMEEFYKKRIDSLIEELEYSRTKEGTYLNILKKIKAQQEDNAKLLRLFVRD